MVECGTGCRVVLGSNPAGATSLRNFAVCDFGNSVYPALAFARLSEETLND